MANAATTAREQQALISIKVGTRELIDAHVINFSGGQIESDSIKIYPGAMQSQVSLGGINSRENVTVTILYDEYMRSIFKELDQACGGANMVVGYQPLSRVKPYPAMGESITYTGTLERVARSDYDASSSDAASIELEMSCNEAIS